MDRAGLAPDRVTLIDVLSRTGRDGALRLSFERRGVRTVVARSRSTLPLQVMAPLALDDPAAVVSVLNPTGGLVGGDRLAIDVVVGPGAHACLTTPSATKVYRTSDEPAVQDVKLRLERDATLEWVPDHTIPFAGSAFRQRIAVSMTGGARLILVDAFSAGRVARGEAWQFDLLDSALTITDERGCRLHDRFVLARDVRWAGLGFTEGAAYFATVVIAGDAGAELRRALQEALVTTSLRRAVAPLPRGGAIMRCLAPTAPALLDGLDVLWAAARRSLLGLPRLALRKS